MRQIIQYILDMLPYMIIALPVVILWRALIVLSLKRKGRKTTVLHELGLLLFALFLIGLASQTVVPKLVFTPGGIRILGVAPEFHRVNLTLFKVVSQTYILLVRDHNFSYFIINVLGNIGMFMPIGFFLPLLWRKVSMVKAVLTGLGISVFIEVCQLFLDRGTDVDDLWLNALGAFLGYLVFLLVRKAAPGFVERFKLDGKRNAK